MLWEQTVSGRIDTVFPKQIDTDIIGALSEAALRVAHLRARRSAARVRSRGTMSSAKARPGALLYYGQSPSGAIPRRTSHLISAPLQSTPPETAAALFREPHGKEGTRMPPSLSTTISQRPEAVKAKPFGCAPPSLDRSGPPRERQPDMRERGRCSGVRIYAHSRRFRAHRKLRLLNGFARKNGSSAARSFMFHYRTKGLSGCQRREKKW